MYLSLQPHIAFTLCVAFLCAAILPVPCAPSHSGVTYATYSLPFPSHAPSTHLPLQHTCYITMPPYPILLGEDWIAIGSQVIRDSGWALVLVNSPCIFTCRALPLCNILSVACLSCTCSTLAHNFVRLFHAAVPFHCRLLLFFPLLILCYFHATFHRCLPDHHQLPACRSAPASYACLRCCTLRLYRCLLYRCDTPPLPHPVPHPSPYAVVPRTSARTHRCPRCRAVPVDPACRCRLPPIHPTTAPPAHNLPPLRHHAAGAGPLKRRHTFQ